MKNILITVVCLLAFCGCSNDIDDQMDGYWQLKTINEGGQVSQIDTVFYAFQRKALFSYTLTTQSDPNETIVTYGYIEYPSEKELLITIDQHNAFDDFLIYAGWNSYEEKFTIESVNKKNLVLKNGNKTYFFKRF